MMYRCFLTGLVLALLAGFAGSCSKLNEDAASDSAAAGTAVSLQEVAQLLAALPMEAQQLEEVRPGHFVACCRVREINEL